MGILRHIKGIVFFGAFSGTCLLISCFSNMPDTFDRIDANKLRVIGVVIRPRPEVSPGDTVTATVYFGGNPVLSLTDLKLAYGYVWGMNGLSFTDIHPVTLLNQNLGLPDSAKFSFVIALDVFNGRQPSSKMSQSTIDSISRLFTQPKDSIAAMISLLPDSQKVALGTIIENMALSPELIFTAHSANGTSLDVGAQFTIKYHVGLPGVTPPNNNPDISWIGICKVPDNYAFGFSFYDPSSSGKFAMTYLYNKNNPALCDSVINVDTGYAYFLVADNGISTKTDSTGRLIADTTLDAITGQNGNRIFETYNYRWFYQNVNIVTDQNDSLMQIDDNGSACIEMKPPNNTAMKTFRAWVAAYDQIAGQQTRPRGMCVRAVSGVFRFSPQYIKVMGGQ
jgi:hypothetical protein